jgi:hypothetical protein
VPPRQTRHCEAEGVELASLVATTTPFRVFKTNGGFGLVDTGESEVYPYSAPFR